ncbi:GNAT family N-acetyltransferase [Halalkalibacter oceani]|uniref:GNAT family N-acetyltransferase n=1 Tax=Halalkalibacter oceani TaxID=1653776 RepID=A0A9X2DPW9_9BACI|nr:GNAT family N-acetyltransferase [Halalkalibacter oceani]MCM3714909.1 GNAT family N-acetyltransferase [Halalkalibacter oceani]
MANQVQDKPLIWSFAANDQTKVTLRPVVKGDASAIIASAAGIVSQGTYLQKERVHTLAEEEAFIEQIDRKDNMYIVVEIGGAVQGVARVLRGELAMKRHTGLYRMWLDDSAQGKGIGKKVLDYTLAWCRQHRLHKLCLTVFSTNEVARRLYEKSGFVTEGVQKDQVWLEDHFADEMFMAYFFDESSTTFK